MSSQADGPLRVSLPEAIATTDGQRNPFPWLRESASETTIKRDDARDTWDVFGYESARTVLADHETFSSDLSFNPGDGDDLINSSMIVSDPPRHTDLKSTVEPFFTHDNVASLAPEIESRTDDLLDQALAGGEMDLIADFSAIIPVETIAMLIGVPPSDREQFREWSMTLVGSRGESPEEIGTAQQELGEYFHGMIARRREEPRDDILSSLVATDMSMPDLLGFCALLLIAGNVTTTNLIGNAVRCLDQYGDQERFHANLDGAIRETLRYRPPAQALGRLVAEDTEIDGQPVPEGDHVTIWLGAANHDPSVWDAPEEFRPTRDGPGHLSFGHGIHFCLGAPLAKLEAKIALDRLLDRTTGLRVTASDPEPVRSSFLHGVGELPVAFARDD